MTLKPRIRDDNITRINYETRLREGIKHNNNPDAIEGMARDMLGWKARIPQVDGGHKEYLISSLYVSERAPKGQQTWHLGLTIDREGCCPVFVLQDIISGTKDRFALKYSEGITEDTRLAIAEIIGSKGQELTVLGHILETMFKIFTERDLTNLRIKLGLSKSEKPWKLVCQTSSMTIDDAAAKRQPEVFGLRDVKEEDPAEVEAEKSGLVYIKMDGNIGNIVNGAGLAMATNDAIDYHGGKSANFLDAGGQATKETMVKAFEIVLRDKRVKAIIVNVYGGKCNRLEMKYEADKVRLGITNCAMIADSIIAATVQLGPITVPIVVRLQGTNSPTGLKLVSS